MEYFHIVPNLIALIISSVAIVSLLILGQKKKNTDCGLLIGWLTAGIFFSVFIHSIIEFLEALDLINEDLLMLTMAGLISVGSICFIFAILTDILADKAKEDIYNKNNIISNPNGKPN